MSGSSIGTVVGGIVGGIVGYFLGNPVLGAYLGMTIGGGVGTLLDPPKTPKNTGPRLGDLTVQTSTYGAPIPRVYGTISTFGNIFWLENNQIKEVATTESSGGKGIGGGGSEVTTYAYYATFALGLCEGPITAVRKIWIGPKLFYDVSTEDPGTLTASKENEKYFTIYLGDDAQDPDPRMQATLGVNNTPGYRGLAYILFKDLPLADYGNTLLGAQIKCEVVKDGDENYMFSYLDYVDLEQGETRTYHPEINGNILYLPCYQGVYLMYFDISDPSNMIKIGQVNINGGSPRPYSITFDPYRPYAYCSDGGGYFLWSLDVTNPANPFRIDTIMVPNSGTVLLDETGQYVFHGGAPLQVYNVSNPYSIYKAASLSESYGNCGGRFFVVDDMLYMVTDGDYMLVIDVSVPYSPSIKAALFLSSSDPRWIAVTENGYAYIITSTDNEILVVDISDPENPFELTPVDRTNVSGKMVTDGNYLYIISGGNNSLLEVFKIKDSYDVPYLVASESINNSVENMSLTVRDNYIYIGILSEGIKSYYFNEPIITENGVTLGSIVSAESLQSSFLTAGDIDVTSLTPTVRGYKVSDLDSIRGAIDPLRAAWPFDVRQHGYKIEFLLRGGVSVDSIDEDELDARAMSDRPGVQITNVREMDSVLPMKVSIKYFDVNREYDVSEQYSQRLNTDAVSVRSMDFAIVFTAQEAAEKTETLLYLYWLERYDLDFSLPQSYLHLEPGDVITIMTSYATYEVRLTSINYTAEGRLECKAKYNSASVYTEGLIENPGSFYNPSALGESGQSTGITLQPKGDSVMRLLDIPMLQDEYDTPGYVVALTGYKSGWPGGVIYQSSDNGESWSRLAAFVSPGSSIGYALDSLSTHGGTDLDKVSTLTVKMYTGTLSSVTEAQMFSGQNWFAYGWDTRWEIIAAQNCTLQADGTYILTDFMRGQMGTEWAASEHENGDALVLLNQDSLAFINVNSSNIGVDKLYRGVTAGEMIDTALNITFGYQGVNLEPLSPCHLSGHRHPTTNDWTITWVRRSRFPGWRDYIDAQLGETSESYEIEVYSSGTYATLKRTITATSASASYTSAQQVTDFGSNQSTLYLKIYQLSSVVGRGYPLTSSITR